MTKLATIEKKVSLDYSGFFQPGTVDLLNEDLAKEDVKQRDGTGKQKLSYIASFHAINEANRIFGFGNWSTEIMHLQQIDKTEYTKPAYEAGDPPKDMISISYNCHLKLTISNGHRSVSHEDTGFGNGVAGKTAYGIGSCIELASKEAVTDALKRCLRYYGNKFGLSLYDKDSAPVGSLEIEKAKVVTPEQLDNLRSLYEARGIDDQWVITAIKTENYPNNELETMRFDWYELALRITTDFKLDEITKANYEEDIKKVIKLLNNPANFTMLKATFQEAWEKTGAQGDKTKQLEVQKIYEQLKTKFEAGS